MPTPAPHAPRRTLLQRLRRELARLERGARAGGDAGVLPLGLPAIDAALPGGGLARGSLHEIGGAPGHAAAAGFAAFLLGRFAAHGPVVWIGPRAELFAPGLAALGLAPDQLIEVRARRRQDRLWALEEVLRHADIAAGLAEIGTLGLNEGRRLQLAAEAKGVSALLLRPAGTLEQPSAAFTRWRIAATGRARDGRPRRRDPGAPRLWVELLRARGGRPGAWVIEGCAGEWHEVADPLALAADAPDRPAAPAREA